VAHRESALLDPRRRAQPTLGLTVYACEPDEAAVFDELCPRFGVVPTLTSDAVSAARPVLVPGNRCISVGHKSEVAAPELRALRDAGVEYISTRSIGLDHIDVRAADRLGITVDNVTYAPDGVAEYTLMLILMSIRNVMGIVRSAERHDFRLSGVRGRDLRDMTVGVVGLGRIGTAVVHRLHGFGCRVLACGNPPAEPVAAEFVALDELLRESDVVTLHLPLTAHTRHIIGGRQLATMKHGAFLVNTGRGALVDTGALVAALEAGHLGGVAVDVLEGEEGIFYADHTARPVDHHWLLRLQQMPNAIVTPHTAYYTRRALQDTVERTLINCLRFERNRTNAETEDRDLVRGLLGRA
jgi:D-specific alpha-keto acid dehydrogenase